MVAYKDMDFVWVSNHWDFHREGICRHNGELAQFSCIDVWPEDWQSCGEDCDGCPKCEYEVVCTIRPLTWWQKAWWVWRKRVFEVCVGHHWSYPRVQEEWIRLPSGIMAQKRNRLQKVLRILYYMPDKKPKH